MLIITREVDYAMRILRALADGKQKATAQICKEEVLPVQFVYRILKKMEKGGFVKIARGKEGGVQLATDLTQVNMYDLLYSIETKQYINACLAPGYECEYRKENVKPCAVHEHLKNLQAGLEDELRNIPISTMMDYSEAEQ
jgi:Rrf2 family protein